MVSIIVISDEIKADSKVAISALKQLNIKSVMLTGDVKKNADYTAEQIGIDKVYSQLLPQDKVSKLEEILSSKNPKKNVAFVGDGINDAPVLMRSDVGIALCGVLFSNDNFDSYWIYEWNSDRIRRSDGN